MRQNSQPITYQTEGTVSIWSNITRSLTDLALLLRFGVGEMGLVFKVIIERVYH